jgi:uncharacterized protein YigE (DUF2233 family)
VVAPGVEIAEIRVSQPVWGDTFDLAVVRARPDLVSVGVVFTNGVLLARSRTSALDFSLTELAQQLHPLAILNGGATESFSRPIPAGLLIANRQLVSRLNPTSRVMSGVFWVRGKTCGISGRKVVMTAGLDGAIQSGPIVMIGGKLAVYGNERRTPRYARSLVGLDRAGRVLLIATSRASLYSVGSRLTKSEAGGGVNCVSALNLDGGDSSGLIVRGRNVVNHWGTVTSIVASAISLTARH